MKVREEDGDKTRVEKAASTQVLKDSGVQMADCCLAQVLTVPTTFQCMLGNKRLTLEFYLNLNSTVSEQNHQDNYFICVSQEEEIPQTKRCRYTDNNL